MLRIVRRFAFASCVLSLVFGASPAAAAAARKVAVIPPEAADSGVGDISDVGVSLNDMLGKRGDISLIAIGDVAKALAAAKAKNSDCLLNEGCVASLARDLHADVALYTTVAKSGPKYTVDMWLVNGTGGPSKQASESMKKRASMQMNLEECVEKLLGKDSGPPARAPQSAIAPRPAAAEAPATPSANPSVKKRIMVMDMQTSGVDAKAAGPISEIIAKEIATHPGYDVASSDDVRRMLSNQADKQAAGCTQDEGCLLEISKKLNADFIVNGTVGQIGSSYVINIALMNPKEMGKASGASETVSRLEDLPKAAIICVGKLFKWSGAGNAAAFHLPKGKKMSFAIMDLKPTGISISTAQNLTQVLSVEVKGVEGASVISREDISAMLQLSATKIQVGCGDDSCMSEIGGALGVDRLIAGDVGKIGESFIVNLRLIDVRHGEVENRVTETYRGDEDQLLRAVRHSGRELLGLPAEGEGRLAVTANENGAAVFVDNLKKGVAPIPIDGLKVGRHDVRVAHDGWFDWHGEVYVDPLETTSVWAQLKEQPQAWYQKWWVWTIAGVVVAGAATTAIVATRPPSDTATGHVTIQ